MATSRIAELASQVQESVAALDKYMYTNGLPTPSFDEDGPEEFGLDESIEAKNARETALAATLELHELLLGPGDLLRPILNGTSLQAIARYDIAQKVPLGGEISFAELSEKCGLDERNLRRILRYAMFNHRCFRELRKGYVTHTAASKRLATDENARAGLGYMFEECWPGMARTMDAVEKFGGDEVNQTGWSLSQDTELSPWEYYEKNPEKGARVAGAMKSFSGAPELLPTKLIETYPWHEIGNGTGTLVDVGGSGGHISVGIAQQAPGLKLIVQDLPAPLKKAAIPESVADRVELMAHDFFTPQPVQADAYFFRQIFHDWSDSNVLKIIRATVPALRLGARIIINEFIVPEPGTLPFAKEKRIRGMDMTMLTLFNSRERDQEDWHVIFKEADKRFGKIKVWVPEGAILGAVEAIWEG